MENLQHLAILNQIGLHWSTIITIQNLTNQKKGNSKATSFLVSDQQQNLILKRSTGISRHITKRLVLHMQVPRMIKNDSPIPFFKAFSKDLNLILTHHAVDNQATNGMLNRSHKKKKVLKTCENYKNYVLEYLGVLCFSDYS